MKAIKGWFGRRTGPEIYLYSLCAVALAIGASWLYGSFLLLGWIAALVSAAIVVFILVGTYFDLSGNIRVAYVIFVVLFVGSFVVRYFLATQ